MVLRVWNNHTRLLLPSAETAPSAWKKWSGVIDTVIIKGWDGWTPPSVTDATRAQMVLNPCITCGQLVRIPLHDTNRYDGVCENWWGAGIHVPIPPTLPHTGGTHHGEDAPLS